MKLKVLTLRATSLVGYFGLGDIAHASPSQTFPLFPTSCAQPAYTNLVDSVRGTSNVGAPFVNESESWSEQVSYAANLKNNLDSAALQLAYLASRGEDRKVTKKQRVAARRLIAQYDRDPSDFGLLLDWGEQEFKIGTLTYSCFTASCPQGVQCSSVSPHLEAERALSRLPKRRLLFNKIMTWASGVKHLREQVPSYRATYDAAEVEVRRALAAVPKEIFRIDVVLEN